MSETIPFTQAKAHLTELLDKVVGEHERFILTRNGRPVAVLLSPDELDSLEETIEILRDPDLAESLRESRREAAAGERLRLEDPWR